MIAQRPAPFGDKVSADTVTTKFLAHNTYNWF